MRLLSLIFLTILIIIKGYSQNTWDRTYDCNRTQNVKAVFQTADEGYLIAGYVNGWSAGAWLIKTDSNGDTIWTRLYDYGINGDSPIYSVIQTNTGGYVFVGSSTSSGLTLTKVNSEGKIIYIKSYWKTVAIHGNCINETIDSGYIIVGELGGVGYRKLLLFKTNSDGDSLWSKIYGDDAEKEYFGYSVRQTPDGGFIIAGGIYTDYNTLWIVKTDSIGDSLWTKKYLKPGYKSVTAKAIGNTSQDSEYVVLCNSDKIENSSLNYDIWLLKIKASGDTIWTRTYGGNNRDVGYSLQNTKDRGYIISGETSSFNKKGIDAWLIKTDIEGNMIWNQVYNRWTDGNAIDVKQTLDDGYIFVGNTQSIEDLNTIFWLVKTDSIGFSELLLDIDKNKYPVQSFLLNQNYPNPFNSGTKISYCLKSSCVVTIKVYDITGREIMILVDRYQSAGRHSLSFDANDLASGIYIYRLKTGSFEQSRKMILLR